jgi:hypothetical protein
VPAKADWTLANVSGSEWPLEAATGDLAAREAALVHLAPEPFNDLPQVVHIVLNDLSNLFYARRLRIRRLRAGLIVDGVHAQ